MKRIVKIIFSIIAISIIISMPVFADSVGGYEFNIETPDNTTEATNVAGSILAMVQWISVVGGVIVITIIGIKYMIGSLEEKAQYKKSLLPLVVGIFIVVMATTITRILFEAF